MEQFDFSGLYEDLLKGYTSIEDASKFMKMEDVKSIIESYITKSDYESYTEEDLQNIYMIINVAQYIYNNSGFDTGLSDTEYDLLYAIMLENGGSDIISVPNVLDDEVVYHKYPILRGTLSKTFYLSNDEERTNPSRKYLDEWKSSMENKIYQSTGKHINLDNEEIYVFPKFDGVSGIFEMNPDGTIDRVLTRGYTVTNEAKNVTHQFQYLNKRKYNEFPKDTELYRLMTTKPEDR